MQSTPRRDLLAIFQAALRRVNGVEAVRQELVRDKYQDSSPVYLIAIGKAAAAMTEGALEVLGNRVVSGLVITKHGHLDGLNDERLQLIEADHPVPGAPSLAAGQELIDFCQSVPSGVRLLVLVSGGASSLVEVLPSGFSLQDLESLTRILLGSGLDISAINRIRQEVSRIKGGKLLRSLPDCDIEVLVISDVPGDDPAMIGSGLFYPVENARDVVWPSAALSYREKLGVPEPLPANVLHPVHVIVANLEAAKRAAAASASKMGYAVHLHDRFMEGNVTEVAEELSGYLHRAGEGVHIWGGETTVRLPAQPGRGGRNQHLGLSMARLIQGNSQLTVLVAGTDGTDGPTEDAGALVDGGTVERGELAGLDVGTALQAFDSGRFLEASGDLITTGPTGTNVMDLLLAIVMPSK